MLKAGYVPEPLRQGRTILVYKGKEDTKSLSSWRPITIYSIERRVIEKVLDKELRKQITFSKNQRGLITGLPGIHVSARIIDVIIKDNKKKKNDCAIVFLEIKASSIRV